MMLSGESKEEYRRLPIGEGGGNLLIMTLIVKEKKGNLASLIKLLLLYTVCWCSAMSHLSSISIHTQGTLKGWRERAVQMR